jgi:hypothetical protein
MLRVTATALGCVVAGGVGAAPEGGAEKRRTADGLSFKSQNGDWSARFTGRVQGDYRYFSPAEALPDTFDLRRARLGLELTFFQDYLFYVEGEFATGNPQQNTPQFASLTNA